MVAGEVDRLKRMEAVGGLEAVVCVYPLVCPARLEEVEGAALGEVLDIVDYRSGHGYLYLALRMLRDELPRGVSRPVGVGVALRVPVVILVEVVVRHQLAVFQGERVACDRAALERHGTAVIGVADSAADRSGGVLRGVVVRPEVRHVVVIYVGGSYESLRV